MNGKLRSVTAIVFFAFAAIICSRAIGQQTAPEGNIGLGQCVGLSGAQIVSPFADRYSCVSLGSASGVESPYGGLTFKYNDANTLLIGGAAGSSAGRIYQIGVTRNATGHITGFSGPARLYPSSASRIGQYNDGGVTFGPDDVLFVTRYPNNQIEESKPGSATVNQLAELTPLGLPSSVGALAFVPTGYPGAHRLKLVSFTGGGWYDLNYRPDGKGTFLLDAPSLRASIGGGPEGIAFVPQGSRYFLRIVS